MNSYHQLAAKLFCMLIPLCVACSGGDDDGDDAPAPPNEWNGKTYLIELGLRHWSEPRGDVVREFEPYVRGFLLTVNGASSSDYDVSLGTLNLNPDNMVPPPAASQDMCNPTATLKGNGNFFGSDISHKVTLNIRHLDEDVNVYATAHNFSLTNALPTGGVVSETGHFAATLDAREIAPLFLALTGAGMTPTREQLCETLLEMGAPCEPCPHDSEPWCLTLEAVNFGATESTLPLLPVSDSDSKADACKGGLAD